VFRNDVYETTKIQHGVAGKRDVGGSAEVVSRILAVQIGRGASRIRQGVRRSSDQRHQQPVRASRPVGAKRRVQNGRGLLAQGKFHEITLCKKYNVSRFSVRKRR